MRLATLGFGFLLGAIVFIAASLVLAWTGPTSAPPSGNVLAPINVGTTDQIKSAGLGVNALAVFGNAILSGTSRYLNFGAIAGSSGYGIRDNAGTMEFKSSGGSWSNLANSVLNILGTGTVTQIKFADGTTQTTALPSCTTDGATLRWNASSHSWACQEVPKAPKTVTFLTGGTYTVPGGISYIEIELWGGGGSGGIAYNGGTTSCGGQGGEYKKYRIQAANLNPTEPVVVGAGGVGPPTGNNSANPGTYSTFGNAIWAKGGAGGAGQSYSAQSATNYTPTDGRSVSVWTLLGQENGGAGGCGNTFPGAGTTNAGPGGGGGINSYGTLTLGGTASATGAQGGQGAASWSSIESSAGTVPGAAGGGDYWNSATVNSGAQGKVVVTYTEQ